MDVFFKDPKVYEAEIVRLRNVLMMELRHSFELEDNIKEKDKFIITLLNKIGDLNNGLKKI